MSLDADGFALLPSVFTPDEVRVIAAEWDDVCARHASDGAILAGESGPAYGARDLLRLWPRVIELARHPRLLNSLLEVVGPGGGVVRALYFDKPPGHSWALPWHKDYTVAVKEHRASGVFNKPTKKAGVPHVEAPAELLQRMVTARVHLDDMTDENGALRVVPGSHNFYRTSDDAPRPAVAVHCAAGDVLLMRPLLTHSSGHCRPDTPRHRRIVHLECAPLAELSDGYEWHDFAPLGVHEINPLGRDAERSARGALRSASRPSDKPRHTMRFLLALGAIALVTPARGAVVVLGNFSPDEVTVTVAEPMGKPQTITLTAFQVAPVTVSGPADITFPTKQGKTTLRLDVCNAFALIPDRDAGLKLEGIELPGTPPEADAKPEPKPLPRGVFKVPVTLLVDDDDPRTDRVWQPQVKKRLEEASAAVEAHCGVRFEFAGFATWKITPTATDLPDILADFQKAVKVKPGHVAVGWTTKRPPADDQTVGLTSGAGASHVLIRDGRPPTEIERTEVLTHFLGQVMGAVHSPDGGSVMRPRLGDGFARKRDFKLRFDPLNTLVMNLWADEFRRGPNRKVGDFSAQSKTRLLRVYQALQAALPESRGAEPYLKLLEGDPPETKKP